jgi:hypothetical protein
MPKINNIFSDYNTINITPISVYPFLTSKRFIFLDSN